MKQEWIMATIMGLTLSWLPLTVACEGDTGPAGPPGQPGMDGIGIGEQGPPGMDGATVSVLEWEGSIHKKFPVPLTWTEPAIITVEFYVKGLGWVPSAEHSRRDGTLLLHGIGKKYRVRIYQFQEKP